MYYPEKIEDVCYKKQHIEQVLRVIEKNFSKYFDDYVKTEKGNLLDDEDISALAKKFRITTTKKKPKFDNKSNLDNIINYEIEQYKKDRKKYLELLDLETLKEYDTDTGFFKDTILRNHCPIIHHTLQNKNAKELDKYRFEFNKADPTELLETIINITEFAYEYKNKLSKVINFYNINSVEELLLSELEEEEYIVYGVIGGGIKSHFLFKLYPDLFAYRSRDAVWALWYLTDKNKFDCEQDSEFLMINLNDNTTQQNYFYPYDLFGFYAVKILNLLKEKFKHLNVNFNESYRFVIVDSFLSFVAQKHIDEINLLKSKVKYDGYF